MPSFDVVSKIDLAEVKNAVNQAQKEVAQRFDFRGTDTTIALDKEEITIASATEDRVRAAHEVLQERLVKRGIPLKSVDSAEPLPAGGGRCKQTIKFKQGIGKDLAKDLQRIIKDSKAKVQAQYQDEQLRITGKKKDDLQEVIALLKAQDLPQPLQYVNFRD